MSESVAIVVFFVFYTIFIIGLAFSLCLIIGHLVNIVWRLLNRLFPKVFLTREQLDENLTKIKEFIEHDS